MGKRPPFVPTIEDDKLFVKRADSHDWLESSFDERSLDGANQEFLGTSVGARRISFFFLCILAMLAILIVRAGYLQAIEGTEFAESAQRNKIRSIPLIAKRGVIYDRNKKVLAGNIPRFSLEITPADLPTSTEDRRAVVNKVAQLIKMDEREIEELVQKGSRFEPVIITDKIEYATALALQIAVVKLPGVQIKLDQQRHYYIDESQSLSHVLGYTGKISEKEWQKQQGEYEKNEAIGKSGIELSYEMELKGAHGIREVEVDALGRQKEIISEKKPADGKSLVLTVDASLQKQAESALAAVLDEFKTKRGVVIISDPQTGGILSMVSMPTFRNNDFIKGISTEDYKKITEDPDNPLLNRAVNGEYPSGSTIKLLTAAAALEKKIITINTLFNSNGGLHVGSWFFPDWKAGGHGLTSVTKALAESVNTYFYIIGGGYEDFKGLGAEALVQAFTSFGLGDKTGIDLPQERAGFIPTPDWKKNVKKESWYVGDTYHMAIGQGDVLVTPLQVNEYTAYFANKGKNFTPHLVEYVVDEQTGVTQKKEPQIYRQDIISKDTVDIVRTGMRRGVQDGSSRRLNALSVPVAGKTGTAQWGNDKRPHAWFTGWAPYDNPKIVITVLVEEGQEGSASAISVAESILKGYFNPPKDESVKENKESTSQN